MPPSTSPRHPTLETNSLRRTIARRHATNDTDARPDNDCAECCQPDHLNPPVSCVVCCQSCCFGCCEECPSTMSEAAKPLYLDSHPAAGHMASYEHDNMQNHPHYPRQMSCERRPDPCALDHFNYDDLLCCDLPCPDMSFCNEPCDPNLYLDPCLHPAPCCGDEIPAVTAPLDCSLPHVPCDLPHAPCDLPHLPCDLPPEDHSPCNEPGCYEPAETECYHDQCCTSADACCDLPCAEEHHHSADCTTCSMADVCPHPHHNHTHDQFSLPAGYIPWQRHQGHHHMPPPPTNSSSECSSVEPRLSAALQAALPPFASSPTLTDPRDTPLSSAPSLADSTKSHHHHHHHHAHSRGGHRRLQGATALSASGSYTCQWHPPSHPTPCNATFPTPRDLHDHIHTLHFPPTPSGSGSTHPCHWSGCDSHPFTTRPKLSRHLHSHTSYKPHLCPHPGCGLSFVTSQQRDVHRKKHTGEKPFACAICGKSFAYRDLLKSHMRSGVHGQADKKFACSVCGEGFSDSSNRTKHAKSVHDPKAAVPCPGGCGYVDTRREKLRLHCEASGHALEIVRDPRLWEEFFNRESLARKAGRGGKRKRGAEEEMQRELVVGA